MDNKSNDGLNTIEIKFEDILSSIETKLDNLEKTAKISKIDIKEINKVSKGLNELNNSSFNKAGKLQSITHETSPIHVEIESSKEDTLVFKNFIQATGPIIEEPETNLEEKSNKKTAKTNKIKKVKKQKKQKKVKLSTIFVVLMDLAVAACFLIMYGPNDRFRNTLISTAMSTKSHQYIAYVFFSDNKVNSIVQADTYLPFSSEINLDDIVMDNSEKDHYDNEYDEAVLTREKGNKDYKILDVEVGGYKAYLAVIYDPAKVKLISSKEFNTGRGSESVIKMCNRLDGTVCVNGGGFADPDGWGSDIPQGYLIKDGKIIWSDTTSRMQLIGFTKNNKLWLVDATGEEAIAGGMRDALQFGPYLIVNGEKLQSVSGAGGYSRAARVAVAQRKDGTVLFLVTEGVHSYGPTLTEVADTLELYGAYNAANLDGGSSAQLVEKGKLINTPKTVFGTTVTGGRPVVSGFGLIKG